MAGYDAATIAGTLKGARLPNGAHFVSDVAILTAIALAQQDRGDQTHEGWWGVKLTDLTLAASMLLQLHQDDPSSKATLAAGGDPPYRTQAYLSGRYIAHMPEATAAAASAPRILNNLNDPTTGSPIQQGIDAAGGAVSSLTSWADVLAWFGNRHNWVRVIWGVSGVGLIFIGAAVLFKRDIAAAAKVAAKTAVL